MQNLNILLKTIDVLNQAFDRELSVAPLKIRLKESAPRIKVFPLTEASTDSEGYDYPATIDIKVENQSNHFYSFRLSDGQFIGEGRDLNGPGISGFTLIKRQLREYRARIEFLKLHAEASECNGLVFGESIVVVENTDNYYWNSRFNCVWEIETDQGKSSWYGPSPGDALNNAAPFLNGTPHLIRLKTFAGRFGEKSGYREALQIFRGA